MLSELENYILQKAVDVSKEERIKEYYEVWIEDTGGKLEVKRIEDCRFPLPIDTKRVGLGIHGLIADFSITIVFSRDAPFLVGIDSRFEIRYTGDSSREVVNGIAQEVMDIVRRYPHPSPRIRRRTPLTGILLGVVITLSAYFALVALTQLGTPFKREWLNIAAGASIIGGIGLAYWFFSRSIPYSILDTLHATRPVENAVWFLRLVIGWIVVNVGLRITLNQLFGL